MSDVRRVAFSTLTSGSAVGGTGAGAGTLPGNGAIPSSTTATAAVFNRFGAPETMMSHKSSSGSGNSSGNGSRPTKTIRLSMELFASNSNSYPEFNYKKLIYLEKKKQKKLKNKQNGFSDPFEDNDDDVARIAKELEKKYGSTYASGRGRSKKDDFCDIGLGYDESDSFIDNTEAYDEMIPEEVETVEGGFYINSGPLVFKQLSGTEKTDEIIKMPSKAKKRLLSSSSEESSTTDEDDNDTQTDTGTATTAGVTHVIPAAGPTGNNSSNNKAKTSNKQKTTCSSSKRIKIGSDKESSDKEKPISKKNSTPSSSASSSVTASASASPKDDDVGLEVIGGGSKDKNRAVKTTTVKDMLKAKRDNFLKLQGEDLKAKTTNGELKTTNSVEKISDSETSSDDSDSNEEHSSKKSKKGTEEDSYKLRPCDSKLPELNDELSGDINLMKDTVKSTNRTGKKFQFDEKLSEIFLRIDDGCLCLDKNIRNVVFAHLEYQLMLPKYFLLRKAKQLRITQEKTKTKKAFVKLRKAVADVMLVATQQYQSSLKTYEEFQARNPNVDIQKIDNAPKIPKKKFVWNDTIRTLLYDLYQVRWMSYTVLRTRKETFEDFVNNFLQDKVINIWPNGWVKYEELKREIEKKKNISKKLKENKKPEDSSNSIRSMEKSHTMPIEASINSGNKLPLTSNDIYAVTSQSEIIANNVVSKEVPKHASSTQGSSSADQLQSIKASYSSSGKVHRSSTNSPLNLCSGTSQIKSDKPLSSTSATTNSSQHLNNTRTAGSGSILSGVGKNLDHSSPSKRTDHSINSIMSSPSSTSSSVSTTPQPQHSTGMGSTLPMDSNAHIINIDNYKSTNVIINSSNQIPQTNKNRLPTIIDVHHSQMDAGRDSSSESDGVEIVGVYQAKNTSSSIHPPNKNKYKKSSHQETRSDSPTSSDKMKSTVVSGSKKQVDTYTDLDVNKIMMALKELEELQHTSNFVPDISSLTGSNKHNTNSSPLAYGKDLTQ